MFSRNSASSRAIPVGKQLTKVKTDPAFPIAWTSEQPGMSGGTHLEGIDLEMAQGLFEKVHAGTVEAIESYLGDLDVLYAGDRKAHTLHKSLINRLMEPFMWHTAIITASGDWQNFLMQRDSPLAQPEFAAPAALMGFRDVRLQFFSPASDYHLPLINDEDWGWAAKNCERLEQSEVDLLVKVCTARCARVSALTHDGVRDQEEDIAFYGRLVSAVPSHACYDYETEVLTGRGWKVWPDVTESDTVAAVDISDGSITFEVPVLHSFPYNGKMFYVRGQQVDLLVTPNHNIVSGTRRKDNTWHDFVLRSAEDMVGRPHRTLKSGFLGERREWVNPFRMDATTFASLVGFFVGDGHAARPSHQNPNSLRFHLKRQRKIDFLKSIGLPLVENADNGFAIRIDGIGSWFRNECYTSQDEKCLPTGWLTITSVEWEALKIGLLSSDGSPRRNTWVYASSSLSLVDQIQALAHVNGEVASQTWTPGGGNHKSMCRLNFSTRTMPRIETQQIGRSRTYSDGWEDYSGDIWCATVSSGALLVRRNGKVVVSGNSPLEHPARPDPNNQTIVVEKDQMTGEPKMFAVPRVGNFVGWRQHRHDALGLVGS